MQQKNIKEIIVYVLLLANIGIILMIYFQEQPEPVGFDTYYLKRTEQLQKEKDSLLGVIKQNFITTQVYENKIDSLQKIKNKISYVYVSKYKEIDSANAVGVVSKFTSIFSKSGIR